MKQNIEQHLHNRTLKLLQTVKQLDA